VVVMRSAKNRVFCAGAKNIRMLAGSTHGPKVNSANSQRDPATAWRIPHENSGQALHHRRERLAAGGRL